MILRSSLPIFPHTLSVPLAQRLKTYFPMSQQMAEASDHRANITVSFPPLQMA